MTIFRVYAIWLYYMDNKIIKKYHRMSFYPFIGKMVRFLYYLNDLKVKPKFRCLIQCRISTSFNPKIQRKGVS